MLKRTGETVWQSSGKRCDIHECGRLIRPGETVDKAVIHWATEDADSIIICSDCKERVYGRQDH